MFTLAGALLATGLGLDGVGLRFFGRARDCNLTRCFENELILRGLLFAGVGIFFIIFLVKGERLIDLVEDFACETALLYVEDFLTDLLALDDAFFTLLLSFLSDHPNSP